MEAAKATEGAEVIQIDDQIMVKEFNIQEITKSNLDLMEKQILEIPATPTTPKQYNSSKDKHIALKKLLPQIEERRKELKAPVLEKGKDIDKTAKKAVSMVQPLIELAGSRRFAWEDVKAEEKAAKDKAEAKIEHDRLGLIQWHMDGLIEDCSPLKYGLSSGKIAGELRFLEMIEVSAVDFDARTEEAEQKLAGTISLARAAHDAAQQHEENQVEAKRLADEKAEFAAKQKEAKDEKDRVSTIETEIKQLEKLCFFLPGIATGVLKAHKENLANMKPSKRIFQEKYPEACSIVEEAFGKSFIAWETAVKQDEIKEKLEDDRKALEKEKADMATAKQADIDRKFAADWNDAHLINFKMIHEYAIKFNRIVDEEAEKQRLEDILECHAEALETNADFDLSRVVDEKLRKEKLQHNKERAALIGPDKRMITTIATDLDKIISEYEIPVLNTAEGNSLVVDLIAGLKTEIHAFETAGGGLV